MHNRQRDFLSLVILSAMSMTPAWGKTWRRQLDRPTAARKRPHPFRISPAHGATMP